MFFDEIDGLAVAREHSSGAISVGDRVMSQLFVDMNETEDNDPQPVFDLNFIRVPQTTYI